MVANLSIMLPGTVNVLSSFGKILLFQRIDRFETDHPVIA
jgi:hypothetical protein